MRGCTNTVHDGVNQSLQLLDPALSKILVLVMWFALPISNAISMQDLPDLVTNLDLGMVTDKFGQCSSCPDLVFQSIDELPISLDGIDISDEGFNTNKDLGDGGTRVNG